jgi:tRNA G10  N-methylase Trm11
MIFFILGSHPELSVAEIFAVVGNKPVIARSEQTLILDEVEVNLENLQERLAGTIKIGHIIGEMPKWNEEEAVELVSGFVNEAAGKNKIRFGLSMYGMSADFYSVGKRIKQALKKTGRPARFVTSKEPELSSVIVIENRLLESGGEFIFIKTAEAIFIGQTQTVQDYKVWSKRDYGRPARNTKQGMLPPKLARLMINLACVQPSTSALLDPFCGCGTVLMEGVLLGFKQLIGSDISEKAIQDTARNMTWLVDQFTLTPPSLSLHTSSAQKLDTILKTPMDVIVTETFLGKPKLKPLNEHEFFQIKKELFFIYEPSFRTLAKLLKPGGKIVVAIPAFLVGKEYRRLDLNDFFTLLGFSISQIFLYHRPSQIVAREILVMNR